MIDVDIMLENAAVASQHKPLIDDPHVADAIMRNLRSLLLQEANEGSTFEDVIHQIDHSRYLIR